MKILIVGASGLIGSAIATRLHREQHELVGVSRRPLPVSLPVRHVALDVAQATAPDAWLRHLTGIDAVVYCAGALQDAPGESVAAVHEEGPRALFAACQAAGVRRVIYFSAVGVDREAPTDFSRTKRAGERALTEFDIDWVVLRPSVVIGRAAYGGSALIRGLAALSLVPSVGGTGRLQAVHMADLLDTVEFFLRPGAPARVAIELVGPQAWTFDELVALFRHWLGWRRARRLPLPAWLMALLFRMGDLAGMLGWRSAMRTTAGREILRGAVGDPAPWTALTGIRPRDIAQALAAEPAAVQERWFSRLYLLRPWIFGILALFWIATGVVALGPGWKHGIGLMEEGGVEGLPAALVVVGGGLCDIAVGALIGWRRSSRYGLYAALGVTVLYALTGTALVPRLWIDPMGPMLKVLPIVVLHLAALAIVDDR